MSLPTARIALSDGPRTLPQETPVAMVFDGVTHAVMMASPADLEDFAVGFALTEGIITARDEITELELVPQPDGIEARMWLAMDRSAALTARRRTLAGAVGCGMCGLDSLAAANRDLPQVGGSLRLTRAQVAGALDLLHTAQPLQDATRAVHAAGFLTPDGAMTVREDVGRHNALDKLIGALLRAGMDPAGGAIVITSRVSVEMVQKTAMAGSPILIAASAPTSYALSLAEGAGITLAASARGATFDLFTHPNRIED
ncbi:MAG: sulfurtransferase FdhD [Rhodobacterales bacterium]|nr:MAG: sulfurtransferase FdhD [Rhodobacterales bacterium]